MPTYEYECPKCQQKVELVQSIKDRKPPNCDKEGCSGQEMVTIIGAGAFVLKGTHWARDGYSGFPGDGRRKR